VGSTKGGPVKDVPKKGVPEGVSHNGGLPRGVQKGKAAKGGPPRGH
jgi:hypothetical protein